MKRVSFSILSLFFTLIFTGNAIAAEDKQPTPPTTALFYPNEIYLTVEEKLVPENIPGKGHGLVIVLPLGASRSTFSLTVDDKPASSFYWFDKKEPKNSISKSSDGYTVTNLEEETDLVRRDLFAAIVTLQKEVDKVNAALKATEARIELWATIQSRKNDLSPDEILKLDGAFTQHLPELFAARTKETRALQDLGKSLKEADLAVRKYDESNVRHVGVIPIDGPDGKTRLVRYSYIVAGSHSTAYRLTAYPSKEKLAIEQDVFLYQTSGYTWKDVDVYIATTRRDTAIRPPAITPWNISFILKETPVEGERVRDRARSRVHFSDAQISENLANVADLSRSIPVVQEEKGTFRLWNMGRRTINSNVPVNLPLSKEEYKALYYYTLQPAHNPKGFLTADLTLDIPLELPQGKARFFVDNVAIGEQPMSLNGNKATIFFGTDPMVTATRRNIESTTGEQGFINKEQTVLWNWEILVRNTRNRPVDVRVYDPFPNRLDTAIKVTVESTPKPEETFTPAQLGTRKVYMWKETLRPGEAKTINHKVQVVAPIDKQLTPGRLN